MDYTKYNAQEIKSASYDQGLRQFMLQVYNNMAIGLAITAIVSMFAASSESFMSLLYTVNNGKLSVSGFGWLVALAPLAIVITMSATIRTMSFPMVRVLFGVYAASIGLSLATIFLAYTGESIARTFLVTAATFGGMSIYGYTTKRNLTTLGSFFMMGLIGVLLASLVNLFINSSALNFMLSIASVVIFTFFTAYDTQKLKHIYLEMGSTDTVSINKAALMGALNLYMDFINLFIHLLRIMGDRK